MTHSASPHSVATSSPGSPTPAAHRPPAAGALRPEIIQQAEQQARRAAEASQVQVRQLTTPEEHTAAADLLDAIWNPDGDGESVMQPGLLTAMEHAGSYVAGAWDRGDLVGVTIGFFGPPSAGLMHSHIAGVAPAAMRRGIGAAMKLHQRAWCLHHGVHTMEWTFDPLIARNARFNLTRLGAQLAEYLPEFYGQMRDGINAGQGSDRALIRWHLDRQYPEVPEPAAATGEEAVLLHVGEDHQPRPVSDDALAAAEAAGTDVLLQIPEDVEALRSAAPKTAAQWRTALREAMHPLMAAGWTVAGLTAEGFYLLRPPAHSPR